MSTWIPVDTYPKLQEHSPRLHDRIFRITIIHTLINLPLQNHSLIRQLRQTSQRIPFDPRPLCTKNVIDSSFLRLPNELRTPTIFSPSPPRSNSALFVVLPHARRRGETANVHVFKADMSGLKKEKLKVEVEETTLHR